MNIQRYCYKKKHQLQISTLIVHLSHKEDYYENCYNAFYNPFMCLLVIQDMCIGIFMPMHLAKKFGYIRMILERQEYYTLKQKTSCIVITINDKWDTSKWSYELLSKFYTTMNDFITDTTIEEIKKGESWILHHIDMAFLEALCYQ
jgi:hypothetical protein